MRAWKNCLSTELVGGSIPKTVMEYRGGSPYTVILNTNFKGIINMKNNVFLAIGLHKTGSSFFQIGIFPNINGIKHIHLRGSIINEFQNDWKYDKVLISSEALSGSPWDNNYIRRYRYKNFENRKLSWNKKFRNSVKNIRRLFSNAKIIIVFRKHSSLIKSIYKQYLHEGGQKEINKFFDVEDDKGVIKKFELFFSERVELLYELFGEENVFVSTYEIMCEDKVLFITRLLEFMGVKEYNDANELVKSNDRNINIGVKRTQSKLLRFFNLIDVYLSNSVLLPTLNNRIFTRIGINPRKLFQYKLRWIDKRDIKLDADYQNSIDNYYKDDWTSIQKYLR